VSCELLHANLIALFYFPDSSALITHAFCFECVVRAASTTSNKCPMCKARFYKVIHNVRANDDYSLVSS